MTMTPTDIDVGLEERYELQRHDIVYVTIWDHGSVLGCTRCHTQVTVTVNDMGGWRLSNDELDKLCAG